MNLSYLAILALGLLFLLIDQASAKCYRFGGAPEGVFVCVGKNSDSFEDRKNAKAICTEIMEINCGTISSTSSSCHSNSNRCYDENKIAHRSLSGY